MKRLFIFIMVMMIAVLSLGYKIDDNTEAQVDKLIENPDGTKAYLYSDGLIYEGEIDSKHRKSGEGTLYMDDRIITGVFKNNDIDLGTIVYDNGDVYEGEIFRYMANGSGEKRYANGDKYVGKFKYDKKHGKGFMIFDNKDTYTGEYSLDVMHGKGKLIQNEILTQGLFNYGKYIKYLPAADF